MSKINAAPDSLAETTLLISGTLAHGDVFRGPVDMLSVPYDADDTIPALYYSVLDIVLDDAVGPGLALQKMGLEPLTEAEARLNIASQLWIELSNFSGGEVVLDDLRVILRGYPAKPLPKDYTRTAAPAIAQAGDITVKTRDGIAIPCAFTQTSLIGPVGTSGPGYKATSATPLVLTAGAKTLATQTNLAYQPGTFLKLSSAANPTDNWMWGPVTNYSGTSLAATITTLGPDADGLEHDDWLLSVTGERGPNGTDGSDGIDGTNGTNGTDGIDGSMWRDGSGVPSNALGADGDYYLDNATGDVYVKAVGVYTTDTNIKGPPGDEGPQGEQGDPGPQGDPGTATTDASDLITGTLDNARLAASTRTRYVTFQIDGGGSAIAAGWKGKFKVPAGTIQGAYLESINPDDGAALSGSIVIDIHKNSNSASIVASAKPTLSSASSYSDTTLTGWTVSLTDGDWLYIEVEGTPATVELVALTLKIQV